MNLTEKHEVLSKGQQKKKKKNCRQIVNEELKTQSSDGSI